MRAFPVWQSGCFYAVAVLGASGLYAQTKTTATIPFEFTVQNTTLPAGEYTLSAPSKFHDVIKEAIDEAVKQGVPAEAARDFILGHINIDIGILFGYVNSPFSDGAL